MRGPLLFWDVDTQVDFMDPAGALYVPGAEQITSNLARLTHKATCLSIPVIADADDHELSDSEICGEPDFQTTFPPHCLRGAPGAERVAATRLEWTLELGHDRRPLAEIRQGVETPWPRVLILKKRLDVFTNPNTDAVFEMLRPRQVVVYGVALDFCVRLLVEGLLDRGQRSIIIITDATKAIYPQIAEQLFRKWTSAGVRLETTESFLRQLEHPSRVAVG